MFSEQCSVLKCQKCGLVYKELIPSEAELTATYADGYEHFQSAATSLAEINSAKQKLRRCCKLLGGKPKAPRLLDVGCGAGSFVAIARNLGYEAEGIDPYLPVNSTTQFVSRKSPEVVADASYDIVTMLNIAEHLVHPRPTFAAIYRILKPGGVLLLTCPYGDSWAFRQYQTEWSHLALDEHILFWTPQALRHLLREVGFHGPDNYRIAGLPFPSGWRAASACVMAAETHSSVVAPATVSAHQGVNWQHLLFESSRRIQRQEIFADIMRTLIHWTRTGDYLEYAIRKDSKLGSELGSLG
jgi:2-polyprenyl-3-methyl-5-hydroxy-6-metoxy-1,4-benzoquinol methylase